MPTLRSVVPSSERSLAAIRRIFCASYIVNPVKITTPAIVTIQSRPELFRKRFTRSAMMSPQSAMPQTAPMLERSDLVNVP